MAALRRIMLKKKGNLQAKTLFGVPSSKNQRHSQKTGKEIH